MGKSLDMQPIKSGMATHAGYDPAKQELHVTFHNGETFSYNGVPHNIGNTLMGAASFGTAFNRHVASKYKGKRI